MMMDHDEILLKFDPRNLRAPRVVTVLDRIFGLMVRMYLIME